jgi:hypothetical protein
MKASIVRLQKQMGTLPPTFSTDHVSRARNAVPGEPG